MENCFIVIVLDSIIAFELHHSDANITQFSHNNRSWMHLSTCLRAFQSHTTAWIWGRRWRWRGKLISMTGVINIRQSILREGERIERVNDLFSVPITTHFFYPLSMPTIIPLISSPLSSFFSQGFIDNISPRFSFSWKIHYDLCDSVGLDLDMTQLDFKTLKCQVSLLNVFTFAIGNKPAALHCIVFGQVFPASPMNQGILHTLILYFWSWTLDILLWDGIQPSLIVTQFHFEAKSGFGEQ